MTIYQNPIQKDVIPVDITSAFLKAVDKNQIDKAKKILIYLEKQGYRNPVLYGGALRDIFIGERTPKDWDVEANFSALKYLFKMVEKKEYGEKKLLLDNDPSFIIDLSLRNKERRKQGIIEKILRADAPINAIAFDRKGRVIAHPDFIKHAKNGIYKIRKDLPKINHQASFARFKRINAKYDNWILK